MQDCTQVLLTDVLDKKTSGMTFGSQLRVVQKLGGGGGGGEGGEEGTITERVKKVVELLAPHHYHCTRRTKVHASLPPPPPPKKKGKESEQVIVSWLWLAPIAACRLLCVEKGLKCPFQHPSNKRERWGPYRD